MTTVTKSKNIIIPALKTEILKIKLKGKTSLIQNKFGATAMKSMDDKYRGNATNKVARDPDREYKESAHVIYGMDFNDKETNHVFGHKADAFKKAVQRVAMTFTDSGIKGTHIAGAIFIIPATQQAQHRLQWLSSEHRKQYCHA